MFSNRVFLVTFCISLALHSLILLQVPGFDIFTPNNKNEQKLEVSYVQEPLEQKEPLAKQPKIEPLMKLPSKITAEKRIPPPFINKERVFKQNKSISLRTPEFLKPNLIKTDVIAIKKKITLPEVNLDKINNPSYISYYQIVREKIKRAAYNNYTRNETGEIYISFVIANDGALQEVRLVEDKSTANPYLIEIALKSIRDAAVFPSFPKELDYPRLSFNVAISFEIE